MGRLSLCGRRSLAGGSLRARSPEPGAWLSAPGAGTPALGEGVSPQDGSQIQTGEHGNAAHGAASTRRGWDRGRGSGRRIHRPPPTPPRAECSRPRLWDQIQPQHQSTMVLTLPTQPAHLHPVCLGPEPKAAGLGSGCWWAGSGEHEDKPGTGEARPDPQPAAQLSSGALAGGKGCLFLHLPGGPSRCARCDWPLVNLRQEMYRVEFL